VEVGCYTLDLYCDSCNFGEPLGFPDQFKGTTYEVCRARAEAAGWHWTKCQPQSLLCPKCNPVTEEEAGQSSNRGHRQ
jgi:hypothetical protein